ncbi:MAG: DUF1232 domain-containing protein [Elusimicrobiaceae bacterium]|nr:DUF1232 domain-containing protein [Elusimicrobiaceae bacterium]
MNFSPQVIWSDVKTFFPMVWAILRGRYRIPWGTIVWALVCAVYFISPVDALPDVLPALGIADDGAFIVWVLVRLHGDLAAFRQHREEKPTIILEAEVTKQNKSGK